MNTDLNIIDNTIYCDESIGYISKEHTCCEDKTNVTDRSAYWYILPIVFEDKNLCDKNTINDISYTDLEGMSLLYITYNSCIKNLLDFIENNKPLVYNNEKIGGEYKITIKVPEDKRYLCNIVAKKGSSAINKVLFNKYFLKLL